MKNKKAQIERIGSWGGYFIGKQLRKRWLNIWCENCKSKHKAWLK